MKHYLLFTGECYYPSGGWDDFTGAFDSIEAAKKARRQGDWAHIVDTTTMKIVLEYSERRMRDGTYERRWI